MSKFCNISSSNESFFATSCQQDYTDFTIEFQCVESVVQLGYSLNIERVELGCSVDCNCCNIVFGRDKDIFIVHGLSVCDRKRNRKNGSLSKFCFKSNSS